MNRVLEPELMTDHDQAEAYAAPDFAAVNQGFVDRFRARFPDFERGHLMDLGCGPADIPIRFCRALAGVTVTAVDGSTAWCPIACCTTCRGPWCSGPKSRGSAVRAPPCW